MAANILIATPQVEFGELLRLNIEESGDYNISVVTTGKKAIEKANKIKFDLAILDPTITDQPFATLVQNLNNENSNLRLVVIQSQITTDDQELQSMTIHAFLNRSFSPPDMIEMIQNLLNVPPSPSQENKSLKDGELIEINSPLSVADTVTETMLEEGSTEPAPQENDGPKSIENSTLDELAREIDNQNQSEKAAGQDDIDSIFQQFSENKSDISLPLSPNSVDDAASNPIDNQPPHDLKQQGLSPDGIGKSLSEFYQPTGADIEHQEELEKLPDELKSTGPVEDSTNFSPEKIANTSPTSSETSPTTIPLPPPGDENLYIEDSELAAKHSHLASKYASLAYEYSTLASEHHVMASKHAELATDKAQKDREMLEILKALDPVIEQVKRLLADTAAQAALVVRSGKITAVAGNLIPTAVQEVAVTLSENWYGDNRGDLVRFVRLSGIANEVMLYASSIRDEFILGLIFDNATPLSRMRTQTLQMARKLASQQLDMVDISEPAPDDETLYPESVTKFQIQPLEEMEPNVWIPENINAKSDEDQLPSILQDRFAQLEATGQRDEFPEIGTELTLEEEFNNLFASGDKSVFTSLEKNEVSENTPLQGEVIQDIPVPPINAEVFESANKEMSSPNAFEESDSSNSQQQTDPDQVYQADIEKSETVNLQDTTGVDMGLLDVESQFMAHDVDADSQPEQRLGLDSDHADINLTLGEPDPDVAPLETINAFPTAPYLDNDNLHHEGSISTPSFDNSMKIPELHNTGLDEILANVQSQLKHQSDTSSPFPSETGDTADIQENIPQGPSEKANNEAEFNSNKPSDGQTPTDEVNILNQVSAQLDRQAISSTPDEKEDLSSRIPFAEQPEDLSLEPINAISNSEEIPFNGPLSPSDLDESQNPARIFQEIISRLETSLAGSEQAEDKFIYPWENEMPVQTKGSATQPVQVSSPASQTDIPTSPIRVSPAIDFVKSEMNNLKMEEGGGEPGFKFQVKDMGSPEFKADSKDNIRDTASTDSTESIQMKYNGDIDYLFDWQAPPDKKLNPALSQHFSVSQLLNNVAYTCVLVPRLPEVLITGELANYLSEVLPQICLVFGWHLEKVNFQADYMQWTVHMLPAVSPGHLVRVIRQRTSKHIYQKFPPLKEQKTSDDFWAPGYLILNGSEPPSKTAMDDFIQQTRRRQRLLQNLSH